MKEDWMTALAGRQRDYESAVSPESVCESAKKIRRTLRFKALMNGMALLAPIVLFLAFSPGTQPSPLFTDAESGENTITIGASRHSGKTPSPVAAADSSDVDIPWYKKTEEQKIAVVIDSLHGRFGLKVRVPKGCRAEIVKDGGSWMPSTLFKGRGWRTITIPRMSITSHDGECLFLFEDANYYDRRRIAKERLHGNKNRILDELCMVFRDVPNLRDSLSSLPAKRFRADSVLTYGAPLGGTAFSFFYPGDSLDTGLMVKQSSLEKLRTTRFPVIRRYFFIKQGHISYGVTVMMTEKAAARKSGYERLLGHIVRYDPDVRYEDLSWYLTPEADAFYRHRQDSIQAEQAKFKARNKALKARGALGDSVKAVLPVR